MAKNREEEEHSKVVALTEEEEEELEEQLGSSLTLERVAAAKKLIEDHYKSHMKLIQDRKQRFLIFYLRLYSFIFFIQYINSNFHVYVNLLYIIYFECKM